MGKNVSEVFWLLAAIVLIILTLVLWILLVPVTIVGDTEKRSCFIRQYGTFSFVISVKDSIETQVKILGLNVKSGRSGKTKKEHRKRKKRKTRSKTSKTRFSRSTLIRGAMKSITLKKLTVDLDTGDVVLNAQLFPLAYFITNEARSRVVNINFEGVVWIQLSAEVRLYKILFTYLKYLFKRQ